MTTAPATAVHPGAGPADDVTGSGRTEVSTVAYVRSPRDLLRVVAFGAATLVLLAVTRVGEGAVLGFEEDLVEVASFLSPAAERLLAGTLGLVVLLSVAGTWIVPVLTRRYRLFGYVALANVVTATCFAGVQRLLERADSEVVANQIGERAGLESDSMVSLVVLAQLAGTFTVLAPFVGARWRRAGGIALPLMVLARIIVSVQLPAEVFVGVALGVTVGSAVLLGLGRPSRRPTDAAIVAALAASALPVIDLQRASVDARGSTPYVATLADGEGLVVKVLGEDERAADLLVRLYRFVRLRDPGDDRPFSNLRRAVEHEALVALAARDVGVRTPRVRGVVDVGSDSMLLAYDRVDGRPLDALADEEVTDDLVVRTWEQVAELRSRRIAHRDLRRANVVVAADGEPWIIGFGSSELAASESLLRADVAQLLASFAVAVGAERAVACAIEVLGPDAVGAALPRLQAMALHGATRRALAAREGLLAELQQEVARRCGVEEIAYEQLERVSGKAVFTVAMLAAVTYFLLPQFADLPEIVDRVQGANWWWLPAMLAASALTYVGAAIAMRGAVADPLPMGSTLLTQVASSFTSTLAPAGVGGMAVNVRFLQKQGVDHAIAVSSVGLNTAAGVLGHVALLVVFAVWAGGDAFASVHLPDLEVFALVGLGLLVVGAIALAVPVTRALVRRRLLPVVQRAAGGIAEVLARPAKLVQLLGGSMLVTFAYLLCAYFGVEAFGGGLGFATVGACYLLGSAVATAAPTPGGLGAMEAALIAALVAAGLDDAVAVPAVFLFRFATFWIPILPGWMAFTFLRRGACI
jgi:undecaprenyl-diphosphatase